HRHRPPHHRTRRGPQHPDRPPRGKHPEAETGAGRRSTDSRHQEGGQQECRHGGGTREPRQVHHRHDGHGPRQQHGPRHWSRGGDSPSRPHPVPENQEQPRADRRARCRQDDRH
ncbi:hypothetical protein BN1708_018951, partial [Verticillium longisporum]